MPKTPSLADQFAQLRQQRSAVAVLLFLLVIVVFWIGVGLFSSQQKFAVPKEMRDLATPLSPIIDESVFGLIEQKRAYTPEELLNFTIYKVTVNEATKQLRLVDISYQDQLLPTPSVSPTSNNGPGSGTTSSTSATTAASGSSVTTPVTAPTQAP